MLRQAVVVAGGKGVRLGELAKKYGNKSLVPINGIPLLGYTLEWLREAGVCEIIISVNYMSEYRKVAELFGGDSDILLSHNRYRTSSAQCLPPLLERLDSRFLFVYGHAPAPPNHLRGICDLASKGVAVSLYSTTTQGATRKPASIREDVVKLEDSGSLFIEPPHVLTSDFVYILNRSRSWGAAFKRYQGSLVDLRAVHPPEVHYRKNFTRLKRYIETF